MNVLKNILTRVPFLGLCFLYSMVSCKNGKSSAEHQQPTHTQHTVAEQTTGGMQNSTKDITYEMIQKATTAKMEFLADVLRDLKQNNPVQVSEAVDSPTRQRSPLHYAIELGDPDIVGILLAVGANVNAENDNGNTPLHYAAAKDNSEIVKALLGCSGIKVNAKNAEGNTPLHYAAAKDNTETVKALLGCSGIEVNAKNKNLETPLYIAAQEGRVDIVKELLTHKEIDLQAASKIGNTPLGIAMLSKEATVFDRKKKQTYETIIQALKAAQKAKLSK